MPVIRRLPIVSAMHRGEKETGYFFIERPTRRVVEALSKDEKLVPIVQADQSLSNIAAGSSRSKRSITAFRSNRPRSKMNKGETPTFREFSKRRNVRKPGSLARTCEATAQT